MFCNVSITFANNFLSCCNASMTCMRSTSFYIMDSPRSLRLFSPPRSLRLSSALRQTQPRCRRLPKKHSPIARTCSRPWRRMDSPWSRIGGAARRPRGRARPWRGMATPCVTPRRRFAAIACRARGRGAEWRRLGRSTNCAAIARSCLRPWRGMAGLYRLGGALRRSRGRVAAVAQDGRALSTPDNCADARSRLWPWRKMATPCITHRRRRAAIARSSGRALEGTPCITPRGAARRSRGRARGRGKNGFALQFASEERGDREVVSAAAQRVWALECDQRSRAPTARSLAAVTQQGGTLEYALEAAPAIARSC